MKVWVVDTLLFPDWDIDKIFDSYEKAIAYIKEKQKPDEPNNYDIREFEVE